MVSGKHRNQIPRFKAIGHKFRNVFHLFVINPGVAGHVPSLKASQVKKQFVAAQKTNDGG